MNLKYIAPVLFFIHLSANAKDPKDVGFWEGAAYKVGVNKKLESELAEKEQRTTQLSQELEVENQKLYTSIKNLDSILSRFSDIEKEGEIARTESRKVRAQLRLAKQDLTSEQDQLNTLTEKVEKLKTQKEQKLETKIRLEKAEKELKQTRESIALLVDHIESDLILEAENALSYD